MPHIYASDGTGGTSSHLLFSSEYKYHSPGKPVVYKASEVFTAGKTYQLLWFMMEVPVRSQKI